MCLLSVISQPQQWDGLGTIRAAAPQEKKIVAVLCALFCSNIYPTRCNVTQFILSGNCSTCFGWYHHPSSGAQTSVSTVSGICNTVIAICRYRGRDATGLSVLWMAYATHSTLKPVAITAWQIPDTVDTLVFTSDDGRWYHPKHVEQFPDKINCVMLHLAGYILEYYYDARTHEG